MYYKQQPLCLTKDKIYNFTEEPILTACAACINNKQKNKTNNYSLKNVLYIYQRE